MYREACNQIKKSNSVLLVSHVYPDGDAIGSTVAMGAALKGMGKSVTMYNEDGVPPAYRFLPLSDQIVNSIDDVGDYDLAVILDCSKIERVGVISEPVRSVPNIINIDHHCSNEEFGAVCLVNCNACATAEIVYYLIKEMGLEITSDVAYGIYTGIITDTSSFSFNNTSAEVFDICGEMVRAGVDPEFVAGNVYITYSCERIRFMRMVLDTFELSENKQLSFMVVTQDMVEKSGMKPENVGRVVNYAKHIENVKVSAFAIEEENHSGRLPDGFSNFHVSLRSDGNVDVSKIAVSFGGGGHNRAAGFNITTTLEGLHDTIMGLADKL
ncbi:MAG: hypothetical protein B5M56_08105 [Desulfococcus sp. 4484_241]|nr:MAG: hypothetical protein B5M56_08105 [Desulfococcus sp. 4484_241]